ncbi:uncharacterized protein BDZ99DRAFT_465990, partial [Mytilinidion resinicola]
MRFREPFHQKGDASAELGTCWQVWVFDYIIVPMTGAAGKFMIEPAAPMRTEWSEEFPDGQETKDWQGKIESCPGVTFNAAKNNGGRVWQGVDSSKPNNVRIITRAVPMVWIAQWFQRSTWQKWDRLKVGDWSPPLLGPSIVVNMECVKGVMKCYIGLMDENAKPEAEARHH